MTNADRNKTLLQTAVDRVERVWPEFVGKGFPNVGDGLNYVLRDNKNWLAGFWPGILWLTYSQSGDAGLCDYAKSLLPSFEKRLNEHIHINHDLGFLFTLSARAQHQLTGDEHAHALALRAANWLLGRYRPAGRYIQAWQKVGDEAQGGQIIMDTLMNMPFLFWAGQETGDPRYREFALDHIRATANHLVRPDGSTYHTFFFDQHEGTPLHGKTHQGATDESLWSRGQAWGIDGFAMTAQWCPDEPFLIETARKLARRFMDELTPDDVPLWDLWLPEGEPAYKDSSATSIALCGLLRLRTLDAEYSAEYNTYIDRLMNGVVTHLWDNDPEAQGLLKHGAQHVPKGIAVDGYTIFGDYYMLEALMMLNDVAPEFWGPTV